MTRLRGEGPRETTTSQASQPWSADELAETRYWCDNLEDRSPQTNANRRWLATYDDCQRELREFEHMTPIAQDCDSCEPLLDHDPGFDEDYSDDARRGIFA